MATPWNFGYSKLTTPSKFNIRPSYTYTGKNASGNFIYFSLDAAGDTEIATIIVGMSITCSTEPPATEFATRLVTSIDIIENKVGFGGTALGASYSNLTFIFNSNPGVLIGVARPLTGQEIHDNFFYLAEGLVNHQERITTLESYEQTSRSNKKGYVAYNGYHEQEGSFYGYKDLSLEAPNAAVLTNYVNTDLKTFSIAIDNGIREPIENSIFYEIILNDDIGGTPYTYPSTTELCTYLNNKLKNNNKGFWIRSAYSGMNLGTYATVDWSVTKPGFYLRFDDALDAQLYKIELTTKPVDLPNFVDIINAALGALQLSDKITASIYGLGVENQLQLVGSNNRLLGCTRFEIIELSGQTFITDAMRLTVGKVFDFSSIIQFTPVSSTYLKIIGLNPAFKILLKDGTTNPALSHIGFLVGQFLGTTVNYHVSYPSHNDNYLNFDGVLRVTKLETPLLDTSNLIANSGTITSLVITTSFTSNGSAEFKGTFLVSNSSNPGITTSLAYNSLSTTNGTFSGDVSVSGALSITGNTTLKTLNLTTLASGYPIQDDLKFYQATPIAGAPDYTEITANSPKDPITNPLIYTLINGHFGARNIKAFGNLRIYGVNKEVASFYSGAIGPDDAVSRLNYNGNFYATTVNGVSSRKHKTNIADTSIHALDLVMNTKIVDYNFKTDLTSPKIGFIAEDTHPLLSTKDQDSIDITNCIGVLFKAVQEIKESIN